MPLYSINKNKLTKLSSNTVKLEKDLQSLLEANLETVLEVKFLATEYVAGNGRIDTLGIDNDGAPVIIEYKKSSHNSVIPQTMSYARWVKTHPLEFKELCKNKGINSEVCVDNLRIVCIAERFNAHDYDAIYGMNDNVELYSYTIFDNCMIYLNLESANNPQDKKVKPKKGSKIEVIATTKISEEYTIEGHLTKAGPKVRELYIELDKYITELDANILIVPKKIYIAYKLITNFVDVIIQAKSIKLAINVKSGQLEDPDNFAKDLSNTGHLGNGDYECKIESMEDINKAKKLIIQSYNNCR